MTAKSFYQAIPRKWRTPKTMLSLFVIELLITVAALALYGIAAPDLYRTKLWQEGSNHGWNSNPNEILYAYANYRPIKYPTPWDGSYVEESNQYSNFSLTNIIQTARRGLTSSLPFYQYSCFW